MVVVGPPLLIILSVVFWFTRKDVVVAAVALANEPCEYADNNENVETGTTWSLLVSHLPHLYRKKSDRDEQEDNTGGGLIWSNLSSRLPNDQVLLQKFSGSVANGRVCAILGPSGAGKSTFLHALSGNIHTGSVTTSGLVRIFNTTTESDKVSIASLQSNQIAYLQQSDHLFDLLTVKETLQLAAFLEVADETAILGQSDRHQLISSLLDSLGLVHATNTLNRDLSGGERRRLSVGLELVSSPKLFLGDEPTTGLDSRLSLQVIKLLRQLSQTRNIPALISLHQPRSLIWNQLHQVILMARGGRVCFCGRTSEALDYFAILGYPCPPNTNPAEYLIDLVSVDTEDSLQAALDEERIDMLALAFQVHQQKSLASRSSSSSSSMIGTTSIITEDNDETTSLRRRNHFHGPLWYLRRFAALLRRSFRQNIRNTQVNFFRLFASAINALLLANIFPTVRSRDRNEYDGSFIIQPNSLADRVALLSFGAINMAMMSYMKTIDLFAKELPVVQREQKQRHQYSALDYLLSKSIAEVPLDMAFSLVFTTVLKWAAPSLRIGWRPLSAAFSLLTAAGASLGFAVGSWTPAEDPTLATTAGLPILVILMVVGVINPSGVDPNKPKPPLIQWLKAASPFASCIEALCVGEYRGMEFASSHGRRRATSPFRLLKRVSNLPRMGALAMVKNGEQVLQALGLEQQTYSNAMSHLGFLVVANLLISWAGLVFQQHTGRLQWFSRIRKGTRRNKKGSPRSSSSSSSPDDHPVPAAMKVNL